MWVVAQINRLARHRFSTLRAELILEPDTATVEFKSNQALGNQESMNRRQRRSFDALDVLDPIEPTGIFFRCSFGGRVTDSIAIENCQTVLFKLARFCCGIVHDLSIDR